LDQKEDIYTIMRLLRHKDIKTTMNYLHKLEGGLRESAKKLDTILPHGVELIQRPKPVDAASTVISIA
jgi:hypothetical protein